MAKGKGKGTRYKTMLKSSAGTGHRYTKTSGSLVGKQIKKFDPVVHKHVLYKGEKLK